MRERSKAKDAAHRILEATKWHMRLNEKGFKADSEFEDWMAIPANADAWVQTTALWDYLGERARAPEMVAAREEALGGARKFLAQRNLPLISRRRGLIAAGIVLPLAGLGWAGFRWLERRGDYTTEFGERRVVMLSDGSHISLDSDSAVRVRYSQNARELRLLRGQARFDVVHDVERPFSVLAGDQKVIATGTAFNIDMIQGKVRVTLIEGHVVVLDESAPPVAAPGQSPSPGRPSVQLRAGQQLVVLPQKPPEIEVADIQRVTAWTSGQLIFSDEPLFEVVARVSHYSKAPIIISDPKIAQERISGVFNTGDVPGFLDIVTQYYPVAAVTDGEGRIVLRKI
jgi:transmembrane sensor